jgi:sulfur-oxidizing protein SoxY
MLNIASNTHCKDIFHIAGGPVTYFPRRNFLKRTALTAALTAAGGFGAFISLPGRAAEWPKEAFASRKLAEAIAALFGTAQMTSSAAVALKAPAQAENSVQVQFQVSTDLSNVEAIAIFVEKNPGPLIAHASFTGSAAYFSARMKMAETSDVYAVVKSGGKLYMTKQNIKVTVGGCGG